MKSYFIKNGSAWTPTNDANIVIVDRIPNGTYAVQFNKDRGFYLETVEDLKVEGKIYGDVHKNVNRVINTFKSRPSTTGLLLDGEKGSGKTLFARIISAELQKHDVITLLINQPWHGELFNMFIQAINQPKMVFFDEFEKVYNKDEQQALLTLLDGTYNTKTLFIVTTNDRYNVSEYMRNRPGRFFYKFHYEGLDEAFIREYCADRLKDQEQTDHIVTYSKAFYAFNFDILKAIVEEMNRYGETVNQVSKFLNASPNSDKMAYSIRKAIYKDSDIKLNEKTPYHQLISSGHMINPYTGSDNMYVAFLGTDTSEPEDEQYEDNHYAYFTPEDIKSVKDGVIVVDNADVYVEFERQVYKAKSYEDYMAL